MSSLRLLASAALVAWVPSLMGQDAPKKFEVVSIRPIAAPKVQDFTTGAFKAGLTGDPARVRVTGDIALLLTLAYELPYTRFSGLTRKPGSPFPYFELQGTIPAGASRSDVPEMLRNVLVERFGLSAHLEPREQPVYRLGIASGGLKPRYIHVVEGDAPDFTMLRLDSPSKITGTIERLAAQLSLQMSREVLNETGLDGKYEVEFVYERPSYAGGSLAGAKAALAESMAAGLERVGFKITPAKVKLDSVVIDHVSPTPTEN